MVELSAKERDLLQRVYNNEDLRPIFFRKVKGLKWFDVLFDKDYFNPDAIPRPVAAKEDGYVNIPHWPVVDYLVKTSPDLIDDQNSKYAEKFLKILIDVTEYAKRNEFGNYRTWWQFSQIISNIPYKYISIDKVAIVDYWLDDKYESGLVAKEIGEKWLTKLLEENDKNAFQISSTLLGFLYKVVFVERKIGERVRFESSFRFEYYQAQKISEKISYLAGEKLGKKAILLFDTYLKSILLKLKNDSWSSFWQPAIVDNEQNKYKEGAENILVYAYREALNGYISKNPEEANDYLKEMLAGEFQIIHRLAINAINTNYHILSNLLDKLLDKKYLDSHYQHEMWHLLNQNYEQFSEPQKERVLTIILEMTREDDEGNIHDGSTAYQKAIWLASIRVHGNREANLYNKNIALAKTDAYTADHEHPYCSIVNTSLVHALGFVILPLSVHDQSNLTVFFA